LFHFGTLYAENLRVLELFHGFSLFSYPAPISLLRTRMFLNYLKLSLRLLVRNPFFSVINVFGLSIGFAAFIVLWQYTNAELKTDQHYVDYQRMGRIGCFWKWKEEVSVGQMTCGTIPVEQMLKIAADFPQIVDYTRMDEARLVDRFNSLSGFLFSVSHGSNERKSFKETDVVLADSNVFDFFGISLLRGDSRTALGDPNTVVLSRTTAEKYFGEADPLNQILILNDSIALMVTGVFEDFRYTHLNFHVVLSNSAQLDQWSHTTGQWGLCYFKLSPEGDFKELERAIQRNKMKYWGEELKSWTASDADFFVQPLSEIAFSNHFWGDMFWPKSKFMLYGLRIVSILILVMAWINYINLTVARTVRRLKEVAARKINGAGLSDLTTQFLVESAIVHVLAISLALTFMQLIRQPLHIFFGVDIPPIDEISQSNWIAIGATVISGMVVTALYPALTSASYNSRSLLAIHVKRGFGGRVSTLLATFQYTSAVILIIWVSVVLSQLYFILHKELGINTSNVILIEVPASRSKSYESRFDSFMRTLRTRHEATYGQTLMGDATHFRVRVRHLRQDEYFQSDSNGGVDETFIPFFGIQLLAGRNFLPDDRADVVVVSKYVTERLGFSRAEDAIGSLIDMELESDRKLEVVGVMEDYPLRPFVNYGEETGHPNKSREDGIVLTYKNKVFPLMTRGKAAVRIAPQHFEASIRSVANEFGRVFPEAMFTWYPLDNHINRSYDQEKTLSRQIILLAILAIGIACLGLLGMVSNDAEQKVKEIGIRKVMGANLRQIGRLLLRSTAWQMVIAIMMGAPIAWYLGQQYLEKYSQRVDLNGWHLVAPVALLLAILFSSTASVLWRAARNSPVEALKHE